MFRLTVSHLQALTTFPFADALPILGSHTVYSCGIQQLKLSKSFDFVYKVCYLQIVSKHYEYPVIINALLRKNV